MLVVRMETPCAAGDRHWGISNNGSLWLCQECAGHGTVVWGRAYEFGNFFTNVAVAGALAAAFQQGFAYSGAY